MSLTPSISNPNFGFVLLAAAAITFHCTITTFSVAGVRYKVFNEEYVTKKLDTENKEVAKLNGKGIGKGCHPDTGLGRFSAHLTTAQWMEMNIAQRCAGNYHEQLTAIVILEIIAGLFYPRLSASIGAFYIFSRILYNYGFMNQLKKNGFNRGPGFMGSFLSHIILLIVSVYSCLVMTGTISHQSFVQNLENKWA